MYSVCVHVHSVRVQVHTLSTECVLVHTLSTESKPQCGRAVSLAHSELSVSAQSPSEPQHSRFEHDPSASARGPAAPLCARSHVRGARGCVRRAGELNIEFIYLLSAEVKAQVERRESGHHHTHTHTHTHTRRRRS